MASEGQGAVGPTLGEMDLDEFRRAGHRVVDWIADYRAHPESYPVLSRCRPGEIRAQLPRAAPSEAESIECILNDFEGSVTLPNETRNKSPAQLGSRRGDDFAPCLKGRCPEGSVRSC
jgi:aromatic-L-amino-acid decarboxylase